MTGGSLLGYHLRRLACVPGITDFIERGGWCNFDNIGLAVVALITVISTEGWTQVMYNVGRTWGLVPIVDVYFIVVVSFGAFFMLNLVLAVISDEYEKAGEVVEKKVRSVRF